QARSTGAGLVNPPVGHARPQGTVAAAADDFVLPAAEIARHRHAEPGRDGGRRVTGAESVVLALVALAEAGEPTALAQRADAAASAGQDLVRVGLVADVPDQLVLRPVEHFMQSDGEFAPSEAGAEMPAGHRDCVDGLLAKLGCELRQFAVIDGTQIFWGAHPVEQGGRVFGAHQLHEKMSNWPEIRLL